MTQLDQTLSDRGQEEDIRRPVEVFIGSTGERTDYAEVIESIIMKHRGFKPVLWSKSVFRVGEATIESLMRAVESVDAAIFVATPDDVRRMRGVEQMVLRDNVLFEYGLFSGKLGRSRTALAVVGGPTTPSDLLGVTQIYLPENAEQWELKVGQWLNDLVGSRPHIYIGWDSESVAKRHFLKIAEKSEEANYLVLRARDILDEEDGEIAKLSKSKNSALHVRILMLNFEDLTKTQFNEMTRHMNLNWGEKPSLKAERQKARERIAFANGLIKSGMSLQYRLLPANKIPEIKLRLYDDCGYFTFYRRMGTFMEHQDRALFGIDDSGRVSGSPKSPLLRSLRRMYDRLWDSVSEPNTCGISCLKQMRVGMHA
jgi:hypothetical protein